MWQSEDPDGDLPARASDGSQLGLAQIGSPARDGISYIKPSEHKASHRLNANSLKSVDPT